MLKKLKDNLCLTIRENALKEGRHQALVQQREQDRRSRQINCETQFKHLLGKRVVYIPNEWVDPLFGTVVDMVADSDLLLEVADFLSPTPRKVHLAYTSLYRADRKMVEAILKLDSMERWNLSAGKAFNSNLWKPQGKNDHYTPSDVLLKKLEDNNFFQQ